MWAGLSPGTRRRHRPRDESIQFRPALPAFRASYGDRASYSGLLIHDDPRFARSQDGREEVLLVSASGSGYQASGLVIMLVKSLFLAPKTGTDTAHDADTTPSVIDCRLGSITANA
ncbi:hypothetical protein JMJ77_0011458 [Colletotrichum scovillei]|uniref:Uncharacterized protein n=1 Tax=Colletotrichum scovillei TaxID=1209932 RepID=A0A9P7QUS0_9PEZI|nr:hypothetical protein JMJ78_0008150 [Colletotrichum scovillei]KAG7040596.1 hypothetical protein JMJ77_0011458 [Colletotrichum scovillei]KAG7060645.1 hypothetical protein JMJ76_0012216 [Colletotrichum scovillei]